MYVIVIVKYVMVYIIMLLSIDVEGYIIVMMLLLIGVYLYYISDCMLLMMSRYINICN